MTFPAGPRPDAQPPRDAGPAARPEAGAAGALAALYDRHAGAMHALAMRIAGEPGTAEAVVQDVFAAAGRRPGGASPDSRGSASERPNGGVRAVPGAGGPGPFGGAASRLTGAFHNPTCACGARATAPGVHTYHGVYMEVYELDAGGIFGGGDEKLTRLTYGNVNIPISCTGSWSCNGLSPWIAPTGGHAHISANVQVGIRMYRR